MFKILSALLFSGVFASASSPECTKSAVSQDLFEKNGVGKTIQFKKPGGISECLGLIDEKRNKPTVVGSYLTLLGCGLTKTPRSVTYYCQAERSDLCFSLSDHSARMSGYGVVYWTASTESTLVSGCCDDLPTMDEIKNVPLFEGDNWITALYTRDWVNFVYDHLIVTRHRNVLIELFELSPSYLESGKTVRIVAKARIQGIKSPHVSLVRVGSATTVVLGQMRDDGNEPDSLPHDGIFSCLFQLTPASDSLYRLRVRVEHQGGLAFSGIDEYGVSPPYDSAVMALMVSPPLSRTTMRRFGSNLAKMDTTKALEEVISWLSSKQEIRSVGKGIGRGVSVNIVFRNNMAMSIQLVRPKIDTTGWRRLRRDEEWGAP